MSAPERTPSPEEEARQLLVMHNGPQQLASCLQFLRHQFDVIQARMQILLTLSTLALTITGFSGPKIAQTNLIRGPERSKAAARPVERNQRKTIGSTIPSLRPVQSRRARGRVGKSRRASAVHGVASAPRPAENARRSRDLLSNRHLLGQAISEADCAMRSLLGSTASPALPSRSIQTVTRP